MEACLADSCYHELDNGTYIDVERCQLPNTLPDDHPLYNRARGGNYILLMNVEDDEDQRFLIENSHL